MADTFDAVLAEMRAESRFYDGRLVHDAATGGQLEAWADRLAAAHAAEVAERDARIAELRRGIVERGDDVIVPWQLYEEINRTGAEWKSRAEAAEARVRELEAHAADRESEIETIKFERKRAEDGANSAELDALHEQMDVTLQAWSAEKSRAEAAERDARAKQARIDALMLEYCPEDMTPEQVAEWKGAIATTEQADD